MAETIEVRFFAAAADATGCAKDTLELPGEPTVADLKLVLVQAYPRLERVLAVAAFLVGDELTRDPAYRLGAQVDVLPPFAGG